MEYFDTWKGRMKASLLDFAILYITGNYPISGEAVDHDLSSIKKSIEESWGKVKMPTLYSTINRMVEGGLLEAFHTLSAGKVKKQVKITPRGFDMKIEMQEELNRAMQVFKFHDELTEGVD